MKKVTIIAFVLSVLGLVAECIALFNFPYDVGTIGQSVAGLMSSLNLSYFDLRLLRYRNFDTGLTLNYLNLACYLLLFAGAIFYKISKGRETRLIRFILSITFMCNVLFVPSSIGSLIFYWEYMGEAGFSFWIFWFFNLVKYGALAYISYDVLTTLAHSKTIATEAQVENFTGNSVDGPQPASLSKRFTHLVLDLFICIFIFSQFLRFFGSLFFLQEVESLAGERIALYIFVIIARALYYPFYEIIFNATPAKLLTESRVVTSGGQKPAPSTIIARTVARFIPFEPFSFFGEGRWHDSVTNTRVVNEVRTGVSGKRYLLVIPSFMLLALLSYIGHELYDDYKSYVYQKKSYEEKIAGIRNGLKNLTTADLIKIEDINDPYSSDEIFLKVEETEADYITAALFMRKETYSKSLLEIEDLYYQYKESGNLVVIPINRADLDQAYTSDYDQYDDGKKNGTKLLLDDRKFEIVSIDRLFGPSIHDRGTGSYSGDGSISMDLCNYGWPARITALQTLEGNIAWSDELPKEAPTVRDMGYPTFTLHGTGYNKGEKYKFKMTVMDSLDHTQTYLIEGVYLDKTVTRVD